MATDEIKMVYRAKLCGDEALVKCPHCTRIIGLELPIRGEQYQHKGRYGCDGWLEVSHDVSITNL